MLAWLKQGTGKIRHAEVLLDAVYGKDRLLYMLGEADAVAVTCPGTPETENLMSAAAFAAMKPTAHLINVEHGHVVDRPALIEALQQRRIAAAGLDVTREESLAAASPLWSMPHVLITPHTFPGSHHPASRGCRDLPSLATLQ